MWRSAAAALRARALLRRREALAGVFWPGPLTLVLPKADGCPVSELATAGLDSIAVRVPDHPVARDLLKAFGKPVVAPSANQSGHVSPTTAAHVRADLDGRIDLILDGGPTSVGVESTIVSCLGDADAAAARRTAARGDRARARPRAARRRAADAGRSAARARHARLALRAAHAAAAQCASTCEPGEALLAFGARRAARPRTSSISRPSGDLVEAAANLFSHLRALDASGARGIAVMPIPNEGLGEAINDRLARAAAPRP